MSSDHITDTLKVKTCLESWKEIVLLADKFLCWEQTWFSGIIAGVVTLFYLLIWLWDPTFLTFFAFTGLFITLVDFLGPKISSQLFRPEAWTGAKQKHFEQVCQRLSNTYYSVLSGMEYIHQMRGSKPVAHFVVTLIGLFSLAWIGNKLNNFLLAYFATLIVSLLPGLMHHGYIQTLTAQATLKFAEMYKGKELHKKVE